MPVAPAALSSLQLMSWTPQSGEIPLPLRSGDGRRHTIHPMWPFASRGARAATVASSTPSSAQLDYAAFAVNDVAVKVWLPQKLVVALGLISADVDNSRPDLLRAVLFEHVHGKAELARMSDWQRRRSTAVDSDIKFSAKRRVEDPAAGLRILGKAVEDLKLWMPTPLRASLIDLASAEALGLSDYIRKVLVYRLLGEAFHRQWQSAIGRVPIEYREMERQLS